MLIARERYKRGNRKPKDAEGSEGKNRQGTYQAKGNVR